MKRPRGSPRCEVWHHRELQARVEARPRPPRSSRSSTTTASHHRNTPCQIRGRSPRAWPLPAPRHPPTPPAVRRRRWSPRSRNRGRPRCRTGRGCRDRPRILKGPPRDSRNFGFRISDFGFAVRPPGQPTRLLHNPQIRRHSAGGRAAVQAPTADFLSYASVRHKPE